MVLFWTAQTITILITTIHTVVSLGKQRVVIYLQVEYDINTKVSILPEFLISKPNHMFNRGNKSVRCAEMFSSK